MRKAVSNMEIVRQTFTEAVLSQRGDRLRLTEEELSRAELYLGVESLRSGLIDGIGTRTAAIEKAASLAGIRNYGVRDLVIEKPYLLTLFSTSDLDALKSQVSLAPVYYYLYFEQE